MCNAVGDYEMILREREDRERARNARFWLSEEREREKFIDNQIDDWLSEEEQV